MGGAPSDDIIAGSQAEIEELERQTAENIKRALASNTDRAYSHQLRRFVAWCNRHGRDAIPADGRTVYLFLADLSTKGLSVSSMEQALSAISKAHRRAGLPVPQSDVLDEAWRGIRRKHGAAAKNKAMAIEIHHLRRMVDSLDPKRLIDIRDRALLLLGFAGGFRRSELAGIRCEHLEFKGNGIIVTLPRSKADQEGEGRKVGIRSRLTRGLDPVKAVWAWMQASGTEDGPLFRAIDRHGNVGWGPISDKSIARTIKRAASRAGLDPKQISGHSLRSGFITSATKAGKRLDRIMAHVGHRKAGTTMGYVRDAELLSDDNASFDL